MPNSHFIPNKIRIGNIIARTFNDFFENAGIAIILLSIISTFSTYVTLECIRHSKNLLERSYESAVTIKVDSGIQEQLANFDLSQPLLILIAFGLLMLINIIWTECIYEGHSEDHGGLAPFVLKALKMLWTCITITFLFILSIALAALAIGLVAILLGSLMPAISTITSPYITNIIMTIVFCVLTLAAVIVVPTIPLRLLIMIPAVSVGNELSISEAWKCTLNNSSKIVAIHSVLFLIITPLTTILGYILFKDDISYLISNIMPALTIGDSYEIKNILEEALLDYEPSAMNLFLYALPSAFWLLLSIGANTHIYEDLFPALTPTPTDINKPVLAVGPIQISPPSNPIASAYSPFENVETSPADPVGTSSTSGSEAKRLI
ncbi:MAG: hypothetical protein GY804_11150 [Alphaproteobacteria bacterium]|nr:hypothetical protein [Alphaproteobacteria bacterium]